MKYRLFPAALASFLLSAHAALAADYEGMAKPWELGFQPAASPVMDRLESMHDFLLVVISLICFFVLTALLYICVRFRRSNNPVASKTAHNTKLEIVWTVIPILILIAIAIPSLRLHYFMEDDVNPDLTIKVSGYQWYWHYDYPDNGGFGFDSYIKKDEELKPGEHRLLAVDNRLVVPVDTKVRVLLTAGDVIHSWAMPAFGVKRDAVPGRLNSTWFRAEKTGTFYGQCSELCGVGHGFMPIVVDVVSKDDFAKWVLARQEEAGISPAAGTPSGEVEKMIAPITKPVVADHDVPGPVIEKEKQESPELTGPPGGKAPVEKEKGAEKIRPDNAAMPEEEE